METTSQKHSALTAPNTKAMGELLSDLHEQGRPLLPCGLESRINWGAPINTPTQKVSVKGLNRIIEHSIDDLTITVEAGLSLHDLQEALAEHQQWLPVDWPWGTNTSSNPLSSGSIGGLVARGLSGSLRHRHLGIRDQLIGIGMIRTDGISANGGGKVVKNVAGYDLMRLLSGSWGSIAFITKLTLRTQPIRQGHTCLNLQGSLANLEKFRASLMRSNFTAEYFDWVKNESNAWELEIGLASVSNAAVEDQIRQIKNLSNDHLIVLEAKLWEGPLLEQKVNSSLYKDTLWLNRIALPPANVYHFLKSPELKSLDSWKWRIAAGIGVGDGWGEVRSDLHATPTIKIQELRSRIIELRGQLTVLTQPSNEKKPIPAWMDSSSRPLIEAIKKQFDPKQQLSPGRLPGVNY